MLRLHMLRPTLIDLLMLQRGESNKMPLIKLLAKTHFQMPYMSLCADMSRQCTL